MCNRRVCVVVLGAVLFAQLVEPAPTHEPTPSQQAYEVEHAKWVAAGGVDTPFVGHAWTRDDYDKFKAWKKSGGIYSSEQEQRIELEAKIASAERDRAERTSILAISGAGAGYRGYEYMLPGMSIADVQRILGIGREVSSSVGTQLIKWEFDEGLIFVFFSEGKLVSKSR